jgi:uncharacterized membrane protein
VREEKRRREGDSQLIDYLLDWSALFVRWLHLVAGIAWIGSSFYFVWLDNHLERLEDGADPLLSGQLWSVHGGGFYRAVKYRVAPAALPRTLHWFYWEAYTTWISGFTLLSLLYFLKADIFLIDPSVAGLSAFTAVIAAISAIVGSWLIYDGMCRSSLSGKPRLLLLAVATEFSILAFVLCHLFSGRGAFIMFGATLGSVMVANVFFIIIPGQRELVSAKQKGSEPNPASGMKGKQRSIHNTVLTLPTLFTMISNHYAVTYGARYNWLVLIAISFAGACIRGWFVARHRAEAPHGIQPVLPAALAVLSLVSVVIAVAPQTGTTANDIRPSAPVSQVRTIFAQRCLPCHSKSPTQPGFSAPPNGVVLETLGELRAHSLAVQQQLAMRAMPLGNITGMTDAERASVLSWIAGGMKEPGE